MSLIIPKLDNRDWNFLVDEAKRRIAAKCPNWTDFNVSDPGMMLVDLTAWMTETVLYQLNRVPDLNYIKLLELVGVRLRPASPARTWVFFQIAEGIDEEALEAIPKKTRVSTRPQGGVEPVTFSTGSDLQPTTRLIIKTCSRFRSAGVGPVNEREETHHLTGKTPWETDIFLPSGTPASRGTPVPHNLYLGDPALAEFREQGGIIGVRVKVENPEHGHFFLQWEAWDGKHWQGIIPFEDTTEGFRQNGRVLFKEMPAMKPCSKDDIQSGRTEAGTATPSEPGSPLWLRARLVGSTIDNLSSINLASLERESGLEEDKFTQIPRRAFLGTPSLEPSAQARKQGIPPVVLPLQPIEINHDFYPFGTRPLPDAAFYIESPLFEKAGALIQIRLELKKSLPVHEEVPLEIRWEYPALDRSWQPLGISRPEGVTSSDWHLKDGTQAFTKAGRAILEFRCPTNLVSTPIGGQAGWFIRARLGIQNFEHAPDAVVLAESVALRFSSEVRPWATCLSENYSDFAEHTNRAPFSPFRVHPQQDPAFYLCFDGLPSPARKPHRLFLDVVSQVAQTEDPKLWTEEDAMESNAILPDDRNKRWLLRPQERIIKPPGVRMKWEYSVPGGWKALHLITDGTEGFVHEGMLEFISNRDWQATTEFQKTGFWLRVRWELGEFMRRPRLRRVLLNGAEVEQRVPGSSGFRILGSSDGTAGQFFVLHTNILAGPEIEVCEEVKATEKEAEEECERLKKEMNAVARRQGNGCWVKWQEVRNFFLSGPEDRHFRVDLDSGTFFFGDGIRGKLPPAGQQNVRTCYEVTQGRLGNVGVNAITVLDQGLAHVQGVTNFHRAEGGSDTETMDEVKERGPWEIKHRDRAVTEEDFVHLAKKASGLVGPAECYEEDGLIYVIIVPRDSAEKPQPSRWLVEEVTRFLKARCLINTRFKVFGPVYEAIDVQIEIVLDPFFVGRFNEVKVEAEKRLRGFVHPVTGLTGSGWPLGRTLHLSELYYQLEGVEGIDHVGKLRMFRSGSDQPEDNIAIGGRSYPSFDVVRIEQTFD